MTRNWDSGFWDAINLISFLIGVANYSENVSQSQMQETVSSAINDLHEHLRNQDQKIDLILSRLEVG